ncbi:molybdopterin-synthase adenylyltransferase MoeB [Candidatus Bipolaricaulota bacterium]|nr:molybdopterin-synthase adenylyltransferase MoeB [Candidatus Bipolaricaulota bacterium]TFH10215.1 MAG: molybdopterin-synthase adenylyltransferase MoeB [Candidatus Atribacteria bacterium]
MEQRDRVPLTSQERARYARHLVLPHIGEVGQEKLKAARVLLVGVGGLGSAIALYLAGVGVGQLVLLDDDVVSLSNLQRQVLHGTAWLGRPKVESAKERIADLNPDIHVVAVNERFTKETGMDLATGVDLILDGTDNFQARYDINEVCLKQGIPYVYGAIFRLEGQVSLLCTDEGPCYRCLFPEPPSEPVLTGEEAGILGAVPGTIGTIQATEAIKWIVGFGSALIGRLLVYDGAAMRFDTLHIEKNPDCPACGGSRTP